MFAALRILVHLTVYFETEVGIVEVENRIERWKV
jgi:hypothetical protein